MCSRPPSEKWRRFGYIRPLHAKRFVCCALTIRYILYSTVGWSIASISDLGKYGTSAIYISYGPPCCTIYYTYSMVIAQLQEIMYCDEVLYKWNRPSEKWHQFKIFCHLTQKGSSVAHSPYDISHIVRQVGPQALYLTSAAQLSRRFAPR